VNWFRKGPEGRFLWPGYGENSRVLKWIFERCEGTANAVETPIGNLPPPDALDLGGLRGVSRRDVAELLRVDVDGWAGELAGIRDFYGEFDGRLPSELITELDALAARLKASPRP
jgi:phosphoenolpyruvate carboxykinase (GTP)